MARGGVREGAGRKLGSRTRTVAERTAAKAGQTPLEYMLAVMNDASADVARRDQMAVAAAPFVHPLGSHDRTRSRFDQFLPPAARGAD